MKKLLSLFFIVFNACIVAASDFKQKIEPPLHIVVTSQRDTIFATKVFIGPSEFQKVVVVKGTEAVEKYGKGAENGAIIIELKRGSKVLKFQDLKNRNGLANYKTVNLTVDGEPITDPSMTVITKNAIKECKKEILKNDQVALLEVLTQNPKKKPVPGEIIIR